MSATQPNSSYNGFDGSNDFVDPKPKGFASCRSPENSKVKYSPAIPTDSGIGVESLDTEALDRKETHDTITYAVNVTSVDGIEILEPSLGENTTVGEVLNIKQAHGQSSTSESRRYALPQKEFDSKVSDNTDSKLIQKIQDQNASGPIETNFLKLDDRFDSIGIPLKDIPSQTDDETRNHLTEGYFGAQKESILHEKKETSTDMSSQDTRMQDESSGEEGQQAQNFKVGSGCALIDRNIFNMPPTFDFSEKAIQELQKIVSSLECLSEAELPCNMPLSTFFRELKENTAIMLSNQSNRKISREFPKAAQHLDDTKSTTNTNSMQEETIQSTEANNLNPSQMQDSQGLQALCPSWENLKTQHKENEKEMECQESDQDDLKKGLEDDDAGPISVVMNNLKIDNCENEELTGIRKKDHSQKQKTCVVDMEVELKEGEKDLTVIQMMNWLDDAIKKEKYNQSTIDVPDHLSNQQAGFDEGPVHSVRENEETRAFKSCNTIQMKESKKENKKKKRFDEEFEEIKETKSLSETSDGLLSLGLGNKKFCSLCHNFISISLTTTGTSPESINYVHEDKKQIDKDSQSKKSKGPKKPKESTVCSMIIGQMFTKGRVVLSTIDEEEGEEKEKELKYIRVIFRKLLQDKREPLKNCFIKGKFLLSDHSFKQIVEQIQKSEAPKLITEVLKAMILKFFSDDGKEHLTTYKTTCKIGCEETKEKLLTKEYQETLTKALEKNCWKNKHVIEIIKKEKDSYKYELLDCEDNPTTNLLLQDT